MTAATSFTSVGNATPAATPPGTCAASLRNDRSRSGSCSMGGTRVGGARRAVMRCRDGPDNERGSSCRAGLYRSQQEASLDHRVFALFVDRRRDVLPAVDAADFFAVPRAAVPLLAFEPPPFALTGFRAPPASARVSAMRLVATSSCRCSEPIMRPSDSADRSSSDSSSRDRSRAGVARSTFFAIHAPFSRAGCPYASFEQGAGQPACFRRWIARASPNLSEGSARIRSTQSRRGGVRRTA